MMITWLKAALRRIVPTLTRFIIDGPGNDFLGKCTALEFGWCKNLLLVNWTGD